jgi:hypothetical protein
MTTDTTEFQREINEYTDELQQRNMPSAYPARYYDFMSDEGQFEATMVVVLDSQGRALQATLRYDRTLSSAAQNKVLRRAQRLVSTRYQGSGPSTPLYTYDFGQSIDRIDVPHTGEAAPEGAAGSINLLHIVGAVLGLFFIAALVFWMLNSLFRRGEEVRAAATPTALVQPAATAAPAAGAAPTADVSAPGAQTNGLSGSRLANPAIGVGMTVQIQEELRSFVRSEPGSDQGEIVGYLQNGDTALVVGGPTWLQGNSDTIVWWYVELPNGIRGWTPANTSELRLLDVAP